MLRLFLILAAAWAVLSVIGYRRNQRAAKSIADGLLKLRRLQNDETEYVPRGASDSVPAASQQTFDAGLADLTAQNMTSFGDFMERRADGTMHGPMRWFVDGSGTTCGWFAVVASNSGPKPVMTLFSESYTGAFFFTGRGAAQPALAQPPNLTRKLVAWPKGLEAAMEAHRAGTGNSDSLRRVTNAGEAVAMLRRLRANTRTWRATLDPEALTVADARGILGKHYDRIGRTVVRRVNTIGD